MGLSSYEAPYGEVCIGHGNLNVEVPRKRQESNIIPAYSLDDWEDGHSLNANKKLKKPGRWLECILYIWNPDTILDNTWSPSRKTPDTKSGVPLHLP